MRKIKLTPDLLLQAYRMGFFPMSEARDDPDIFWIEPDNRGILPLEGFHLPKRLAKTVRRDVYEVRINTTFREVMELCAAPAPDRPETWINTTILDLYTELHHRSIAHSVECWSNGQLAGGLYGVALGRAFFGESMFSRARDASKVALVWLVAILRRAGFVLLDTQFVTDHLKQFGAQTIPKADYHVMLQEALQGDAWFAADSVPSSGADVIQSITQTS